MTARREATALVLACMVAYGTGLGDVAFYTRGEPREGLVVREILKTGEWVVPRRPAGEIARKPPLYYWLAAPIAAALPSTPELALRLPSAIVGGAAVLGTWAVTRTAIGPAAALPAGLVLLTAFEWTRAATSARVDMALAGALTIVLLAWMMLLAGGDRRRWLAVAAVGASLAALAKGPVGIALPGLVAVAWAAWNRDRSVLRRLGVVPVLGVATLAAAVWYLCAFVEQGRAFIDVVLRENVVRFIDTDDAKAGHAHGFFYLPIVGLVGALPWVPLLPLVAPRRGAAPAVRFAALWTLVIVVFFSLANAKRSVYLLPAFPTIAICIGAAVAEGVSPLVRRLAIAYAPAFVLLAVAALALAAGLDPGRLFHHWLKPDDAHGATAVAAAASRHATAFVALGVAMLGGAVVVERARRAGDFTRVATVVAALMVAGTAAFNGVIHPAVSHTRSLADFMATVDRLVPPDAPLATSFPTDPGLRFYAPRELVQLQTKGADEPRRVLLWQDEWSRLRDARGEALPVLAVSEAQQSRRGSLALVVAPSGELRRVPAAAGGDASPGLRAMPAR
jgi:4-amino-4-deoxy-L-arabinose transferase-like glycosyltransferase